MVQKESGWAKTAKTWLGDQIIDHWPALIIALSGAGVTAIALVSKWLRDYGPAAWVATFLGAVAIMAAIYWLVARARAAAADARYRNMLAASPPTSVNPLRTSFENERLRVADFYFPPAGPHKGKTFSNCDIIGPGAIVVMDHSQLFDDAFLGCDIVAVKGAFIKTAVGFERCSFHSCRFFNVTIFVPANVAKEQLATMLDRSSGKPIEIIGLNA